MEVSRWLLVFIIALFGAAAYGSKNNRSLVVLGEEKAASYYHEEVVVSSQGLRVTASAPQPEEQARVRPVPRRRAIRSTERKSKGSTMKKLTKQFKKMMPYMLVPGMMALGYAPFVLASLKMFVMNAVMINMMAFNAAIFMTLRNMVFGPRNGQHVKYVNFGYSHRKKHNQYH